MRVLSAMVVLLLLSHVPAMAQTSPPGPTIAVSSREGDRLASHRVTVHGLGPAAAYTVVLIDPSGQETAFQGRAQADGTAVLSLAPPNGEWDIGLYRVVLPLTQGQAVSDTFAAGDGSAHIYAEPYLPSPNSVFNFAGFGLQPSTVYTLSLMLSSGQGSRTLQVTTDADGIFSAFTWPQQWGLPFFAAGDYLLHAGELNLDVPFRVREHPSSSSMTAGSPILPGTPLHVMMQDYRPLRALWGVYADDSGRVLGEFFVGPTDVRGSLNAVVGVEVSKAGKYLIGTPYDWGETSFQVLDPVPTSTVVAPSNTATNVPTPTTTTTSTPMPRPAGVICRRARHAKRKWHCHSRESARA